jgi:hypothetical protein
MCLDQEGNATFATGFVQNSVTEGITASTTQTQGEGALITQINQVATVANDSDTVTLPLAVTGREVYIKNDGLNILQIFPAGGDNLNGGANMPTTLEPNESVTFMAHSAANWKVQATTQTPHGQMHDQANTTFFIIDEQAEWHAYHSAGMQSNDTEGLSFDAGGAGTSHAIAAVADSGGAPGTRILVTTSTSHTLAVGAIVSQTDLSDAAYVGIFEVVVVGAATTYEVEAVFTATGTGVMNEGASLSVNPGFEGEYLITWHSSAHSDDKQLIQFVICAGEAEIVGTEVRNSYGPGPDDWRSVSGGGIATLTAGVKLTFGVYNVDDDKNIIVRNFMLVLVRL